LSFRLILTRLETTMDFHIDTEKEKKLLTELARRSDIEAMRMKRYLAMPDLSRTKTSPLYDIVDRVRTLPVLKDFDNVVIPEIVPADVSFDLFNFAPDHVARSASDTYYVDAKNILRTHDTVMWYYYLQLPEIKKKIAEKKSLGVVCYGKVYRKDEIDRKHMNIFHQFGGLYLVPDSVKVPIDELKKVLTAIVEGLFGKGTPYRFLEDTFPYTDPSLQMEVQINGEWLEIMGGGMPRKDVLKNFGLEGYNGWAFGFGLERLAIISMKLPDIRLLWSDDERVKKQLKLGTAFVEVSKYPAVIRDISFVVDAKFAPNDYFDLVRDIVGDLAEEMALVDTYENEKKFGKGNKSYAYRITYRALDHTLTDAEVNALHKKLEERTKEVFNATVR
jgi:phenylalanyl-tRNA synthetase alpha chain